MVNIVAVDLTSEFFLANVMDMRKYGLVDDSCEDTS